MKHELGISVYPDLSPIEDIKEYFKLASKYGFTRVFSSMFSVEGTKKEVLAFFTDMIEAAHECNMKVALDVNAECFHKMGASYNDLSVFADIHVDILRLDVSFGIAKDIEMMSNPYGIVIETNSSSGSVSRLIEGGAKPDQFIVCHNFYPQRYTGLPWKKFLKINDEIKRLGDIRIAAFVSSQNHPTHGVWDATQGLPTVEHLRDYPIDLQTRILLATGKVDDILIGNAYASEEELKSMQEVLNNDFDFFETELGKLALAHGMVDKSQEVNHRVLKMVLDEDITDVEKELLFNFYPHAYIGDGSEWMMRMRFSRNVYNRKDKSIPARLYEKEYFEIGDVVVVNDNYKHYCGEVQIVKLPMKNDGTRNKVGYLSEGEQMLASLINPFEIIIFKN